MIIFTCTLYVLMIFLGAVAVVALMRIESLLEEMLNSSQGVAAAGNGKSQN